MKVVINNWGEDGKKEAVEDWSGITMDYLICAALNTHTHRRTSVTLDVGDTDILHTG